MLNCVTCTLYVTNYMFYVNSDLIHIWILGATQLFSWFLVRTTTLSPQSKIVKKKFNKRVMGVIIVAGLIRCKYKIYFLPYMKEIHISCIQRQSQYGMSDSVPVSRDEFELSAENGTQIQHVTTNRVMWKILEQSRITSRAFQNSKFKKLVCSIEYFLHTKPRFSHCINKSLAVIISRHMYVVTKEPSSILFPYLIYNKTLHYVTNQENLSAIFPSSQVQTLPKLSPQMLQLLCNHIKLFLIIFLLLLLKIDTIL